MTTCIYDIKSLKKIEKTGKSVGLVPTMGNLHTGHASLLQRSRNENDITILSVFINPTQFNDSKDFQQYPRTLNEDLKLAHSHQVDYIFIPDEKSLYPDGYHYKISEAVISQKREGLYRPGHFDGMLTVVMKLLQIIQPTRAYFGEKDYQQLELIQGMVQAFFLDTEIIPCKTVREHSGLAFSSRNNLLSPEQRTFAAHFYQALISHQDCETITNQLNKLGFRVEYIEEHNNRRYGAVYLGNVRLIDNVALLTETN